MDDQQKPSVRVWTQKPPDGTIKPPEYPARPDLFDEVEWGPHLTSEEAKLAYRLWSLPDGVLGEQNHRVQDQPFPRPNVQAERESQDMHALALNVYEHLMRDHLLPKTDDEWDETAQMKLSEDGSATDGWSYEDIFGPQDDEEDDNSPSVEEVIDLEGENVLTAKYWTVVRLQAELRRRSLDHRGRSVELRRRLYDDERQQRRPDPNDEDKGSLWPRTDLSQWGVSRKDDYMVKVTRGARFSPLDLYTWAISLSPYNPAYWVSRSYLYYQMGYFDLAVGDVYRAQLLCEVLVNPRDRNRQPGLYTRIWHAMEQHILQTPREDGELAPAVKRLREPNGVNYFVPTLRKALHNITSLCLKALQCWHDYDYMEQYLKQRVVMPDRDTKAFQTRQAGTKDFVASRKRILSMNKKLFFFERRAGSVSGRPYPYSAKDVNRTSEQFLEKLNREVLADSQLPWKRFQIRPKGDGTDGLAVYAREDIAKGQIIYADEPSVRGHLTITRLVDVRSGHTTKPTRCDNCRKKIRVNLESKYRNRRDREAILSGEHSHACSCTLGRDEPIYFCPPVLPDSDDEDGQVAASTASTQNKTCLQIAQELYHFRTCGRDWKWLHDAMRQNWNRHRAGQEKRPTHITHTYEDHGTLLSLALREVFDITLLRRQRNGNPNLLAHEIDELLPLQSEEEWAEDRFPFTLTANVQIPFDILLRLGVDIFRDLTFDTWVIQIVLRKLLLSVVPWDHERRDLQDKVDQNKAESIKEHLQTNDNRHETRHDPTFKALYLFPGFAMFNHTCLPQNNADWAFDESIPNRIVVWANRRIAKGQEIRLRYRNLWMSKDNALRTLGRHCECSQCREYPPASETDRSPEDDFGPQSPSESADSGDEDADQNDNELEVEEEEGDNARNQTTEDDDKSGDESAAEETQQGSVKHSPAEEGQQRSRPRGKQASYPPEDRSPRKGRKRKSPSYLEEAVVDPLPVGKGMARKQAGPVAKSRSRKEGAREPPATKAANTKLKLTTPQQAGGVEESTESDNAHDQQKGQRKAPKPVSLEEAWPLPGEESDEEPVQAQGRQKRRKRNPT